MEDINILYKILLSDDISLNEYKLFELIPELKFEKGFNQKSEWHCFDVWNHTLAAIAACDNNEEDRLILLLHDIGKPFSYQDDGNIRHFDGHAKKSSEIAKLVLNRFNIEEEKKNMIIKLIEMHSTRILPDDIDSDNYNFYKRLIKIQMCDAKGYEESHSKKIIDQISNIKL